ncbi:MAG TPA: hypothetical protein VEF76_12380 [Patescibacteria group bacterium]|nr:hypothetical protein [Patescibacteria group bacterium]
MKDFRAENVSPLRAMYNRIAVQLGEDENMDFMTRARAAIKRLEAEPGSLDTRDLKSLQFIYNRMVHVHGVNDQAADMKQANEALEEVGALVKRARSSSSGR